eukprot:TRINITY_DN54192_c0_g1_i1.p1 TRINITY_DN54192_c0_g1~~TRINITY_DN54192_c0_g1_i1.p1  ORF type:complete len:235 (-),score=23.82 TRINITY_DN54192_c0_g1_i1:105-809(-)
MHLRCISSIAKVFGTLAALQSITNCGGSSGGSLLPLVLAASDCARLAGCGNLVNGSQERPVLSGTQRFVNDDGTCQHGHAAVGTTCKAGGKCGMSLFECTCISKERAETDLRTNGIAYMVLGGIMILMGFGCFALRWFKSLCKTKNKVAPVVFNGVITAPGMAGPTCVGKPVADGVIGRHPRDAPDRDCNLSCLLTSGITIILPMVAVIVGGIAVVKGLELRDGAYFNECTMTV